MGEMHENITPRQLCKMTSTDEDTMRIRFAKLRKTHPLLFPSPWRIEGELTPDQIKALIQAGQRRGGAPKEDTESAASFAADVTMRTEQGRSNEAAPQGNGRKSFIPEDWRTKLFVFGAFALVIGHAGLIWYDMAVLWAMPGKIGGGVVFVFILSGMVLMSEKGEHMVEIRDNMLWAVGFLEALSVVVHRAAFYRSASAAYAAGLGNEYIWALAAVICLCSIGATVFYQKVIRL